MYNDNHFNYNLPYYYIDILLKKHCLTFLPLPSELTGSKVRERKREIGAGSGKVLESGFELTLTLTPMLPTKLSVLIYINILKSFFMKKLVRRHSRPNIVLLKSFNYTKSQWMGQIVCELNCCLFLTQIYHLIYFYGDLKCNVWIEWITCIIIII